MIKLRLGGAPKIPVKTRWNSLYDALTWLMNHLSTEEDRQKTNSLFRDLDLPAITTEQLVAVKENLCILKPIAEAIDYLQGEKEMHLGCLIPAVESLRVHLSKLST